MPNFDLPIFLVGCLGGLLPDALRIIKNRYEPELASYLKKANFWIGLLLMTAIGGLAAWILAAPTFKDAIVFGFAAPELISQLVGGVIKTEPERVDRKLTKMEKPLSITRWWAS